jgi:serine/threonine-protein kinase RsbT
MTTVTIPIGCEPDIAQASRQAGQVAAQAGFSKLDSYYVATAASELATNVFVHAGGGLLALRLLEERPGIELVASDTGPGIADIALAMQEGYSSTGSLGCGLPGVQRLMDALWIDTTVGMGTRVRACKWR